MVGYRWFALNSATELGLTGWAKNMPDGRVEIKAFGPRGMLDTFIKHLSVGPTISKVNDVNVNWIQYELTYNSFNIKI